ncbi:hypothetical protein DL95DRAFT_164127 [Leptodontidium sp. 2 PMI_412]|nr:hypothetical protein DL95DRAFT_164127 [Leptodontidium sp. 2 PMI_412]
MSRALLISGATGKQGGAVIDALLARPSANFTILAVTRNSQSQAAKRLIAKSPMVKLIEGDLNAVPSLFSTAKTVAGSTPIWGVYSVQASMGKGVTLDGEVKHGMALIDESIKAGVKHFVYSSVERGGESRSWENPTPVPHFKTKHQIEQHLRDATADGKSEMGWTILRPTAFMDSFEPGFGGKVFMTMLRDTLKHKPMQWVAVSDIGFFAAEAFENPEKWNHKAVGIAGDELTFAEMSKVFEKATGQPIGTTFGLLGKALKHGVQEVGAMVEWFKDEGYKANLAELKEVHPGLLNVEAYLRKKKQG